MGIALLFARLLLAAVFAAAGVAKLADRDGSRRAVTDFGVPASLAAPLGVLLPLAEVAVAVALVPVATAWWGALGALFLLLLFAVGIGTNLARGRRPDCHCFGQLHSAPVGWSTLARNAALAAVAAFLVWQGGKGIVGPSAVAWVGELSVLQGLVAVGALLLLGLLATQWWFMSGLLKQNGRLLARLEAVEMKLADAGLAPKPSDNGGRPAAGLPVGTPAPAFALQDLRGEEITLDSLRAPGKAVLLLFTDSGCGPCDDLLPNVAAWQEEHGKDLAVVLVGRGDPDENRAKSEEHGLERIFLLEDWEVSEAYGIAGTPSAMLVRPDGTVGSSLAQGSQEIERLFSQAAAAPTTPGIGEPAPKMTLPGLSGESVSLADFGGVETVVVFWNPRCGFCQEMLPDLKAWERNRPEDAPELLVVSTGDKAANERMGLSSTVVLDEEFRVGRTFGARGTPSAVLVDAEGNVASEVAAGAPAVLELVGPDRSAA